MLNKPIRVVDEEPPIPGDDIVLNLDINVQAHAEQALKSGLEIAKTRPCSDCPVLPKAEVGSTVVYAQAANFGTFTLDSDVVLDPPGPGNNTASGHCHLNLVTGIGLCTFSGGTGKFTFFNASVDVSPPSDGVNWHWDGTYSFSPRD